MLNFIKKIIGTDAERTLKRLEPFVAKINALEPTISILTDKELKEKTSEFKARLAQGEALDSLVVEAFAVVREASKRTLGQRHFDVQLYGGLILNEGGIAEMRTGEGKTLVATLPAYLNALSGDGVHVVTVNDYLSRRDAVWMGQIFSFLGISVGVINHEESFIYDSTHINSSENDRETNLDNKSDKNLDKKRDEVGSFKVVNEFLRPVSRREAYAADITYGTNNEFGFDYLRDNIEYDVNRLRQRGFNFAIVDEIDSILIDEARTPLIISAPHSESGNMYKQFADISKKLVAEEHYTVDEKFRTIALTDAGISKVEEMLGIENMYTDRGISFVHHLETAVRAEALYKKDKDYVVRDNEIVIVDEFTGRLQPGRRWSEGLHQAIEAKENVEIQKESRTFASVTFQNYFRIYKKLSGMTGTALTSAEEFYKVYGLNVLPVPTHRGVLRKDHNDLIYKTESAKFRAVASEVKERNKKGQPVLIGTASITKNELLSEYLKAEGIPHEVLNAKNHTREGEIIAQAGKKGAVTIATNLAGRGVDIKLGGNPAKDEDYEEVKSLGGLFVLGTERHDARRIDNQLRGRSGRQGDPGETQFFVSLDDHLIRVFGGENLKSLMGRVGMTEDMPIESGILTRLIENAQEKIEGFNFDARKHVLEFDDVLNFQRKIMYARRREILVGDSESVVKYIREIDAKYPVENNLELENENSDDSKSKFNIEEIASKLSTDTGYLESVRRVILQTIDMLWIEHLEVMDYMRSSVNLRAYGQRDPLVEYKREGLRLFKEMEMAIEAEVLKLLPQIQSNTVFLNNSPVSNQKLVETREGAEELTKEKQVSSDTKVLRNSDGEKVGRNDPCPCGSGKKYKNCGLVNSEEHERNMQNK